MECLEARAILTEILYQVEIDQVAQNTGDHFKKKKGNKLFASDFRANLMKQSLIWFNLQRDGTAYGLSNTRGTFSQRLQLQTSVLHQSMCMFKTGLSSSYDD